jgi:hypothetical protein
MFIAHGIFGILTIDHQRNVGLAPCGSWPFGVRAATVAHSFDVWPVSRLAG